MRFACNPLHQHLKTMKTTAKLIAMIVLLGAGTWLMTMKAQAHEGIPVQVFYHELSPYGSWIDNPDYGYVWVPDVAPGFHPYSTSGYWAYTEFGWTWVSYYPWGWAPFHYGRWYYDHWYGWVWVPGREWGPGWVSWSHCDGYYGWAPLSPGFRFSLTFNVNFYIPVHHWVYVPARHFGRHDINRYYMHRNENERLYRQSTFIENTGRDDQTNTRYFKGPEVREVRKTTGQDFKPVEVRNNDRPGQEVRNGRMEVYRPKIERNTITDNRTRTTERIKPSSDYNRKSETPVRNTREIKEQKKRTHSNGENDRSGR